MKPVSKTASVDCLKAITPFYNGFWIKTPEGNNAFSFEERKQRKIYVPPLVQAGVESLFVGETPAFVEIDELGKEVAAQGLRHFVFFEKEGVPVFIFDNHNHAFFFWTAAIKCGLLSKGLPLVHVDQHKDTRQPPAFINFDEPLNRFFQYANYELNVGNFLPAALHLRFFREIVQINNDAALAGFIQNQPYALDIDLDIFAPFLSEISQNRKVAILKSMMSQASFITVCTSPYFMDQTQALQIVTALFS